MDGAQDPRAYTVGVGLGFRSRPAGSEGCPLGAWEAEGEVEKWVVMATEALLTLRVQPAVRTSRQQEGRGLWDAEPGTAQAWASVARPP